MAKNKDYELFLDIVADHMLTILAANAVYKCNPSVCISQF